MINTIFSGEALLHWVPLIGYPGLCLIILLETGLVFGFMLPGDSLLFTVGILASRGVLSFWWITLLLILMSALGYVIGYWFGKHLGNWLIKREDSWYFKHRHLERTKEFYERYGARSLFLGRFIPVVRTFIPVTSGMVRMNYVKYSLCNIAGATVWVGGVCSLGYWLGNKVTSIDHYLTPIICGIILLSVMPIVINWLKSR
jgi:membrane-associated protein